MELDKQLDRAVGNLFEKIKEISKYRVVILISVVGGNSVNLFYKKIIEKSNNLKKRYWRKIRFCFGDERLVDLNDNNSNFKLVNKILFKPLIEKNLINKNQIFEIDINKKNYYKNYCALVRKVNILILGVGEDGHICSLFPNHKLLRNKENNYLLINDSPKPPKKRMTMSKNMILNAETSFLFFIGESKKQAYENFKNKNLDFIKCPAKLVLENENSFVICDFN